MTEKAFKYLISEIKNRQLSKLKNLHYTQLKLQDYLCGSGDSTKLKKFAFLLRSRMVKVGHNYGKMDLCPICNNGNNDQRHPLECVLLKMVTPEIMDKSSNYHYDCKQLG